MPLKVRVFRVLARAALTALGLILLVVILIQVQQRVFRYRAERLIADYQAIQLHKSTWADVQKLMHRWGAWGHYDGTCTETNCRYQITLPDLQSSFFGYPEGSRLPEFFFNQPVIHIYEKLGGRLGALRVGFIVQDGTIWRTSAVLDIHLPSRKIILDIDDADGSLVLIAQSRQSLRESIRLSEARWILGNDEQLAQHPTYKVGRPSGCESCLQADVTYALNTSQADIVRFTSYNFDCFTSRNCQILEDLLPASWEWHLYEPPWGLPYKSPKQSSPISCDIPVWALGRDTSEIIAVTALPAKIANEGKSQQIRVRFTDSLKGNTSWTVNQMIDAEPFSGDPQLVPPEAPETLLPHRRYLLLFSPGAIQNDRLVEISKETDPPLLDLGRCGVLDDTAQNRILLTQGFETNDHLRVPEF